MSNQNLIAMGGFRYSTPERVQNEDPFYAVEDSKLNVFYDFDINGDGVLDREEAKQVKLTDEDGGNLLLFDLDRQWNNGVSDSEFKFFDRDKNSADQITPYEFAAGCLYLDSLDGEKDGRIKTSSYNEDMQDIHKLNDIYDNQIMPWKQNYETVAQTKLTEGIEALKNNGDLIPAEKKDAILSELETLQQQGAIGVEDYFGVDASTIGMYHREENRSLIIGLNKDRSYEAPDGVIGADILHELNHYDKIEINKDSDYTIEDEAESFYYQFEFLRKLEEREANNQSITDKISQFFGLTGDNYSQEPLYLDYKNYYLEVQNLPEDQKKAKLLEKLAEKLAPVYEPYINETN